LKLKISKGKTALRRSFLTFSEDDPRESVLLDLERRAALASRLIRLCSWNILGCDER
jgi:hypothetical protein